MSTDYGLRCNTCKVDSYCGIGGGVQALTEAVHIWPHIKAVEASMYYEVSSVYGAWHTIAFLSKHYDHGICIVDEYDKTQEILPPPMKEE